MVIEKIPEDENTTELKGTEQLFMGFISLIVNMTMQQLGKIANPITGAVERNLDIAKAWIDTLKMIQVKTKGNLSDREQRFIDSSIAGLQMNYVDESKKPPEKEPGKEEKGKSEKSAGGDAPKKE